MQIFLQTLAGKTITIKLREEGAFVWELKDSIYEETGIPASHQRLILRDLVLYNTFLLSDYNIQNRATLQLVRSSSDDDVDVRQDLEHYREAVAAVNAIRVIKAKKELVMKAVNFGKRRCMLK